MNVAIPAIGSVIAALAASVVTWAVARRKLSGTVKTTEADRLWDASDTFRESLLTELSRMRDEAIQNRKDMLDSFNESLELRSALEDAKRENTEIRTDNHGLRNRLQALEWAQHLARGAGDPETQGERENP